MKLSSRASRIGESATLRVARRAAELRRSGVSVVDFGAGEPDFRSPAVAVEAACQALADGFTRYTQGSGLPELRQAVAESYRERYGAPWPAAQSVITVGGKAALFELAMAVFDEGQEVILPSPCWVSLPEQVRFAGARPVLVPTSVEDGFRIHAGALLEAVTDRTRAFLINSPCNPTGGIITAEDLREIVRFAAERGLLVISDETYDRFVYDGLSHASAASLAAEFPETVVLVGLVLQDLRHDRLAHRLPARPGRGGPRGRGDPEPRHLERHLLRHGGRPGGAAPRRAGGAGDGGGVPGPPRPADPAAQPAPRLRVPPAGRRLLRLSRGLGRLPARPGRARSRSPSSCSKRRRWRWSPGAAFGADEHIRISFACSRATLAEGLDRMAEVLGTDCSARICSVRTSGTIERPFSGPPAPSFFGGTV